MEDIHKLIVARNFHETTPFISIHTANLTLLNQIDSLQKKCEDLERDLLVQRELADATSTQGGAPSSEGRVGTVTESLALKNETRLREKVEKLNEEMKVKMQEHADDQANALAISKELASTKDTIKSHESEISALKEEIGKKDRALEHLTTELNDAKSRTKLAEQQYVGLKDTIRILQDENDQVKKENTDLSNRFVSEKETLSSEMNKLSEMCDSLKREVDMLRSLKTQEEKRKSWFGLASTSKESPTKEVPDTVNTRKFDPNIPVVLPTAPMQTIIAHASEATCVRYDASGADLIATGSADSTVKVWDTATGSLTATLRGGSSNAILSCDISNGVLVGGGSDKTCRIWNIRTQRMIHHLVGHAHKVTCVRLFGDEKGVITGSADRSLKVWDISRQTYRQTSTLRHSSTANSIDVGIDGFTAVTAHLDGGVRFWDVRTGDRTADIPNLHAGAITAVQFHPTDSSKILTNGMDSCLKLVDIRTCTPLRTFQNPEFHTSYAWSSASFSPDGAHVGSGSNSNGHIFVWETATGALKCNLQAHDAGVCGFAWGRGGSSGQQVSSVDKQGTLVLWK